MEKNFGAQQSLEHAVAMLCQALYQSLEVSHPQHPVPDSGHFYKLLLEWNKKAYGRLT